MKQHGMNYYPAHESFEETDTIVIVESKTLLKQLYFVSLILMFNIDPNKNTDYIV